MQDTSNTFRTFSSAPDILKENKILARVIAVVQWSFVKTIHGSLVESFLGALVVQRPINQEFIPGSVNSENGSIKSSFGSVIPFFSIFLLM